MLQRAKDLLTHPRAPFWCVELFILTNLAFLAVDIFVAHSINHFAHWAEWIPFYFSLASPPILVAAILLQWRTRFPALGRGLGILVGLGSIAVGVAGLCLHLESQFFEIRTLKSLVYTAPFVAPLAYTGIGLLVILNRTPHGSELDWARWVILLAWGGFVGNFVLSLADHAQNGFFAWEEWIPVVVSALSVGFGIAPVLFDASRRFLTLFAGVLALQVAAGLLGFYYHAWANLHAHGTFLDNFIYGAPAFAPLLFPNLALLATLGLWAYWPHAPALTTPPKPAVESSP